MDERPASLGTDIHSPVQSREGWLPLGHKSQLLLARGAICEADDGCACSARPGGGGKGEQEASDLGRFSQIKIVRGQWQRGNSKTCLYSKLRSGARSHSGVMTWFMLLVGDIIRGMGGKSRA